MHASERNGTPQSKQSKACTLTPALPLPPFQVSALTSLRQLNLTSNMGLGRAGAAAWRPLLGLRLLREVELSLCGTRAVPAALAPLSALGVDILIDYATEEEMEEEMDDDMWAET